MSKVRSGHNMFSTLAQLPPRVGMPKPTHACRLFVLSSRVAVQRRPAALVCTPRHQIRRGVEQLVPPILMATKVKSYHMRSKSLACAGPRRYFTVLSSVARARVLREGGFGPNPYSPAFRPFFRAVAAGTHGRNLWSCVLTMRLKTLL
jgi:hypothetical protein